ncbi:RNA helicase required for poly(A+) mRNA export [Lobosporangium transversale]|nr:RNA helicase required for poly(A+) mRNA export [Lobosporangium transversale]
MDLDDRSLDDKTASQLKTLHLAHDIKVQQLNPDSPLQSATTFEQLQLGFSVPSKIQAHALPLLLKDPPQHLIAQAQSGTGKTAAFSLAILSRIDSNNPSTQAIVLAPTRELALQIVEVMRMLAKYTSVVITEVVREKASLVEPIMGQILIGTPGTMEDRLKRYLPYATFEQRRSTTIREKFIEASKVRMFVLDEADYMLDLQGLGSQVQVIKRLLPKDVQLMFFSATWNDKIIRFANDFLGGAPSNSIRLQTYEMMLSNVVQFYVDCENEEDRLKVLVAMYSILTISQSIIFVERRAVAETITERMTERGHHVSFVHGGLSPNKRDARMEKFRTAQTKVLITTNLLARGIDIERITMVINYDLPIASNGRADTTTYVHRMGRTGRFGRTGVCVNFIHDEKSYEIMQQITQFYDHDLHKIPTDLRQEDGPTLAEQESARMDRMEEFIKKHMKT